MSTDNIAVMDFAINKTGLIVGNLKSEKIIEEYLLNGNRTQITKLAKKIQHICHIHKVNFVIIGLPITLESTESQQAKRIKTIIHNMRQYLPPYKYIDESYSTQRAKQLIKDKLSRKPIDVLAARILFYEFINNPKQLL